MTPQTQTQTAHKIIRALWYAWQLPELHRHQATLEQCDGAARAAYEAIEGGAATLARAALTPGPARDLLDLVYQFEPPAELRALLREKAKSLPAEFFERTQKTAVMVWAEIDPGAGEWPQAPRHACHGQDETGAVITIRANETADSPLITPNWRDTDTRPGCQACQHKRAKREARKVLFELQRVGALWGKWLEDETAYKRFSARTRQRRKREAISGGYTAYPTRDGRFFVIHDQAGEGGREVSSDRTAVFNLLTPIVNDTPDDKRVATSGGWGGPWQGTKGDGRVKQAQKAGEETGAAVQLWTAAGVDELVTALGGTLQTGRREYRFKVAAEDAFERLAGFELFERDSNRTGLEAFLEFLGVSVTHKGQGKNPKESLSLMRDTAESGGADLQSSGPPKPINLPGVGVIL